MTPTFYKNLLVNLTFGILLACGAVSINAQTSAFTYQGNLTDSSMSANGVYDFQFQLYNTLGNPSGAAINVDDVTVTNGVFTVQLDFGAGAFQQVLLTSRSMEIRVRPGTSTGAYTALAPRQAFTAAPIAIAATKAETAGVATTANNANALGGTAANQFVQTNDARLTDSRTPTAGSSSYIQNNATATAQPSTNFNISGNGKIGNTLTTFDALISNDLTVQNDVTIQGVFTGGGAGITGLNASNISTGTINAARIPSLDASKITTGSFGTAQIPSLDASRITSGTFSDTRLSNNIPRLSVGNTFAGNNTFSGSNTFTGNQTVNGTLSSTTVNAALQFNLGGNPFISAPSSTNIFAGLGAGGTSNTGASNAFVGTSAGAANTSGASNVFVGRNAGLVNNTGGSNTFVGSGAGNTNTTGSNNTLIGAGASLDANNLTYATAIGAGAVADESNKIVLGRPRVAFGSGIDNVDIPGPLTLGTTRLTSGSGFLSISSTVTTVTGFFNIGSLYSGGTNQLCYSGSSSPFSLAQCSSSIRYKKDVENFSSGLDLVKRLRPVTFTWKSNNQRDLGFVAEEVNAVEPLMTTYNEKGEVEGVKYDRISAALVNAVNEQQTEITLQKETIERQTEQLQNQQRQIDALKQIVCAANPNTAVCRSKK